MTLLFVAMESRASAYVPEVVESDGREVEPTHEGGGLPTTVLPRKRITRFCRPSAGGIVGKTRDWNLVEIDAWGAGTEPLTIVPVFGTDGQTRWWVVGEIHPVFVDGKPFDLTEVFHGVVIQQGAHVWTFLDDGAVASLVYTPAVEPAELIVKDVDFGVPGGSPRKWSATIEPGEFVAIVGPSGCGKSTLVRELIGQGRDSGIVRLGSVDRSTREFLSRMAYLPQGNMLHPTLPLGRQLLLGAWIAGCRDVSPSDVHGVLKELGLDGLFGRRPQQLSGGQQRRAGVALALLRRVQLIVLDEPGAGLDADTEREMVICLRRVTCRGITVLVVTHHEESIGYYDRIIRFQPSGELATERTGTSRPRTISSSMETGNGSVWRSPTIALYRRELRRLWHEQFLGTGVPVALLSGVVIPAFFGMAVGLTIDPISQRGLFGFLLLLTAIWCAASLGSNAFCHERALIDHESFQYGNPIRFSFARGLTLSLVAVVQSLVITAGAVLLDWIIRADENASDVDFCWVFWPMIGTAVAALGVGLLVSAVVQQQGSVASSTLPIILIIQLLFSPAVQRGSDIESSQVLVAYESLSGQPESGLTSSFDSSGSDGTGAESLEDLRRRLITSVSYFTLIRYGDSWARSRRDLEQLEYRKDELSAALSKQESAAAGSSENFIEPDSMEEELLERYHSATRWKYLGGGVLAGIWIGGLLLSGLTIYASMWKGIYRLLSLRFLRP